MTGNSADGVGQVRGTRSARRRLWVFPYIMIAMRGRLTLLILSGALLAGCTSTGTVGSGPGVDAGKGTKSGAPATPAHSSASKPVTGAGPLPGADAAVMIGTGPLAVTVYEDYRCPACKSLHDKIQPVLKNAIGANKIKVEFHAVDLIDHNRGGKGSLAAANAVSCAYQLKNFQAYRDALFAAQPAEADDLFAQPDQLIAVAKTVKGLDRPSFEDCVRNQPFADSIEATYKSAIAGSKYNGVPVILINGKRWQPPTAEDQIVPSFTQALNQPG